MHQTSSPAEMGNSSTASRKPPADESDETRDPASDEVSPKRARMLQIGAIASAVVLAAVLGIAYATTGFGLAHSASPAAPAASSEASKEPASKEASSSAGPSQKTGESKAGSSKGAQAPSSSSSGKSEAKASGGATKDADAVKESSSAEASQNAEGDHAARTQAERQAGEESADPGEEVVEYVYETSDDGSLVESETSHAPPQHQGGSASGGASAAANPSQTDSPQPSAPSGEQGQQSARPAEPVQEPEAPAEQDPVVQVTVSVTSDVVGNPVSASRELSLPVGSTALDAVLESGLEVSVRDTTYGPYVEGIGGLFEKQHGGSSGWLYFVNGSSPTFTAGNYELSEGDVVEWRYTA